MAIASSRNNLVLLLLVWVLAAPPVSAQHPPPPPWEVRLAPVSVSRPVLAHPLLPEVTELEPGNAAQLYLNACLLSAQARAKAVSGTARSAAGVAMGGAGGVPGAAVLQGRPSQQGEQPPPVEEDSDKAVRLLFLQGPEWPREEARALVGRYRAPLDLLDAAARRDACQWEMPPNARGFRAQLPHLPELTFLVNLLSLDARLESLGGRSDVALRRVRTGMAVVQHLAQQPTIVQASSAVFAQRAVLLAVSDLAASPGSPNLYWSIASLPKPLVDPRGVARWERSMLEMTAPRLERALSGRLPPLEWDEAMARLSGVANVDSLFVLSRGRGGGDFGDAVTLARAFALAKRDLAGRPGFGPGQLGDWDVRYVVGIWRYARYRDWTDELWNQFQLPLPQAYAGLVRTQEAIRRSDLNEGSNPFLPLLPELSWTRFTLSLGERQAAAMQAVEAVRDYAANHDGKLPKALAGVDGLLPVPDDPATGKPFVYEVAADGRSAALREAAPEGIPAREESFHLTVGAP